MMDTETSRRARSIALVAAMMLAPFTAGAGAVTDRFFGEDLNGGAFARARPAADAAFARFVGRVPGAIGEDFESDTLAFPSAFGGTLATATVTSEADGRFPISGSRYLALTSLTAPGASFRLDLPMPATAFGFFGIDIGDFDESLSLRLEFDDGSVQDLVVPHTRESANANGAVFFQGLIADAPIASVSFVNLNPAGGTAILAFDDMIVGRARAVPVPAIGTLALLAPAAFGLLALRRRAD